MTDDPADDHRVTGGIGPDPSGGILHRKVQRKLHPVSSLIHGRLAILSVVELLTVKTGFHFKKILYGHFFFPGIIIPKWRIVREKRIYLLIDTFYKSFVDGDARQKAGDRLKGRTRVVQGVSCPAVEIMFVNEFVSFGDQNTMNSGIGVL